MLILGIDFTSAPSPGKPLVAAVGWLSGARLAIERLDAWESFAGFERALQQPGPWVAGLDFPFGFPRAFSDFNQLPAGWQDCVGWLERFHTDDHRADRARYRAWIAAFRDAQAPGNKHPRRLADERAGAVSPLMVYGVPVGMMLLEGAVRLRRAEGSVLPLRPLDSERVALEAYPGLAVRGLLGEKVRYKADGRQDDSLRAANRGRLLAAAAGAPALQTYGVQLQIEPALAAACLGDHRGDRLDALLCALQAAWAYTRRETGWGLPSGLPAYVSENEGWICDPQIQAPWGQHPAPLQ